MYIRPCPFALKSCWGRWAPSPCKDSTANSARGLERDGQPPFQQRLQCRGSGEASSKVCSVDSKLFSTLTIVFSHVFTDQKVTPPGLGTGGGVFMHPHT